MPSFKQLKNRIKTANNTQKVTRAMKLVSAAKLNRAQNNIVRARPYANQLLEVISDLTEVTDSSDHPLLATRNIKKLQLLVLTSDCGLCGAFNNNIIKTAERFFKEQSSRGIDIEISCIGKTAINFFTKRNYPIKRKYYNVIDKPNFQVAKKIAGDIISDFIELENDAFYIVYNKFKSVISQELISEKLLPIEPKEMDKKRQNQNYLFEPGRKEILNNLIPRYFESQVFRAVLESIASEHAARMTAMDNATNNASELIDKLNLQYNKLRQAAITTEINEIVGGAEAI